MQRFVVLGAGRSGSSAIRLMLDAHPDLVCHGELARQNVFKGGALKRLYDQYGPAYIDHHTYDAALPLHLFTQPVLSPPASTGSFVSWFDYLEARAAGAAAVGFKLLAIHLDGIAEPFEALEAARCKVVWLRRENILRQAISAMVARQVGVHNGSSGPQEPRRLTLGPRGVVRSVQRFERITPWLRTGLEASGLEVIEVLFEDFVRDKPAFFAPITGFLGVSPLHDLAPPLAVMTPEPLRQLLANYTQVEAALREAGYGRYLDQEQA